MKYNLKGKIKGSVILITGGTGSFGTTIVEELLKLKPRRVIIFSRDEKKQFDMRNKHSNSLLDFVIGDVRDKEVVDKVVAGVDYIFHAAALKQVPTTEFFPLEAVKTNIIGASNVIDAAIAHQVKKVVVLSTDKAVYPINAMGMSKALMEKVMVAASKNIVINGNKQTVLCGVRYGNVLYSRGSVVPHFIDLMRQNKSLPVTDFAMTRFLLPLKDAVELVLFALTTGENGSLYVRKSPACTLEVLAKALCELFAYKKGYTEVGIRAGEKIYETLLSREERARALDLDAYYKIPPESQDLDYNKYFFLGKKIHLEKIEPYTSENTARLNVEETKALLLSLPEIKTALDQYKKHKQFDNQASVYSILD